MNNPEALSEKPVVLDWNLSVSWVFKSVTNSLFFFTAVKQQRIVQLHAKTQSISLSL